MHIYGLTGGIASGKSTVTSCLTEQGCRIIDADLIAREVVQPGKPAWKLLVHHFGRDILQPDDQIDRAKLASIVFSADFVVLVSPLLFETQKFLWILKKTIVVTCTHDQQLQRLMKRDKISEVAALQKMHSQLPLSTKCKKADIIIDNSKSQDETRTHARQLFEKMQMVYVIVCLSDLECDFLNTTQGCKQLNKWALPEIAATSLVPVILLLSWHWVLFIVTFPAAVYLLRRYLTLSGGSMGIYDPTEIRNRGTLSKFQKEAFIKFGYHLVIFFITLYCFIIALIT
ncbi:hypothetical protein EMCRGX_G032278 [Ephydatia muelleri]